MRSGEHVHLYCDPLTHKKINEMRMALSYRAKDLIEISDVNEKACYEVKESLEHVEISLCYDVYPPQEWMVINGTKDDEMQFFIVAKKEFMDTLQCFADFIYAKSPESSKYFMRQMHICLENYRDF